jgi:hypothetical protein
MMSWLKHPHALPILIMGLYTVTSARYAVAGDWGRVMYWVCAAGITFSATFLVGHK